MFDIGVAILQGAKFVTKPVACSHLTSHSLQTYWAMDVANFPLHSVFCFFFPRDGDTCNFNTLHNY